MQSARLEIKLADAVLWPVAIRLPWLQRTPDFRNCDYTNFARSAEKSKDNAELHRGRPL
jgi:hypothetical protein